jgi:hypothetical protein
MLTRLLALQLLCFAMPCAASNSSDIMMAAAHFGAANPPALASAIAKHELGPALSDLASLDRAEQVELYELGGNRSFFTFLSGVIP